MTQLKTQLLTASMSVSKYASEIQKMASDIEAGQGSLSPDQVKEILTGVNNNLMGLSSEIKKVAEGVPASGDDDMAEPETPQMGEDGKPKVANTPELGLEEGHEPKVDRKTAYGKSAGDPSGDKLREQVASLMAERDAMKKASMAKEYSSLFPLSMRKAKETEFLASTEPLHILTAKLEGAKTAVSSQKLASKGSNYLQTINPAKENIFTGVTSQRMAKGPADLTDI